MDGSAIAGYCDEFFKGDRAGANFDASAHFDRSMRCHVPIVTPVTGERHSRARTRVSHPRQNG